MACCRARTRGDRSEPRQRLRGRAGASGGGRDGGRRRRRAAAPAPDPLCASVWRRCGIELIAGAEPIDTKGRLRISAVTAPDGRAATGRLSLRPAPDGWRLDAQRPPVLAIAGQGVAWDDADTGLRARQHRRRSERVGRRMPGQLRACGLPRAGLGGRRRRCGPDAPRRRSRAWTRRIGRLSV